MAPIIILGAGESGISSALLAQREGMDVFVSDYGSISPENKALLNQHHIPFEEGGHKLPTLCPNAIIIKSPGIPNTAEVIVRSKSIGAKVISEIEFAAPYVSQPPIAITGSNGKTTTTSLITHLLNSVGISATSCGNIGYSLARLALERPSDLPVIELSSFQLDDMYVSRMHIALLLNITPDHLDRYGYKIENYADAKGRIFQNQCSSDFAIQNADDAQTQALLHRMPKSNAHHLYFSTKNQQADAYFDGKWIHFKSGATIDFDTLSIKGEHNAQNVMAACLAIQAQGTDLNDPRVLKALQGFQSIQHRMEHLGEWQGVTFINDSKGTNLDATQHALGAMPDGKTILIIGGTDKGNDYQEIYDLVRQKCKALIYLTKDNKKLHTSFDSLQLSTKEAYSMREVFENIKELRPKEGDIVLLSPACASFDLFKSYEDRGEQFTQNFHTLTNTTL